MKLYKLYADMTDTELEQVDLVEFTSLKIGDRVTHLNAGAFAGSNGRISSQAGTIMGHQNQGLSHYGSLCVTVDVKWDDLSETRMVYTLAVPTKKA